MSDPITGYEVARVRCVKCRKITRDPRIAPDGFCCPHCVPAEEGNSASVLAEKNAQIEALKAEVERLKNPLYKVRPTATRPPMPRCPVCTYKISRCVCPRRPSGMPLPLPPQKPSVDDEATRLGALASETSGTKENDRDSLIALVKELSESLQECLTAFGFQEMEDDGEMLGITMSVIESRNRAKQSSRTALDKVREAGL